MDFYIFAYLYLLINYSLEDDYYSHINLIVGLRF